LDVTGSEHKGEGVVDKVKLNDPGLAPGVLLVTPADAAKMLSISRSKVYELVSSRHAAPCPRRIEHPAARGRPAQAGGGGEVMQYVTLAENVPSDAIPVALAQLAAAHSTLTARLLASASRTQVAPVADENWISVDEAGKKVGRARRWFYRHQRRLPFVKRLSRKVLLVGEHGLNAWIAAQK
jgi:predicted DNA-binding transcriptional regulator AlpA